MENRLEELFTSLTAEMRSTLAKLQESITALERGKLTASRMSRDLPGLSPAVPEAALTQALLKGKKAFGDQILDAEESAEDDVSDEGSLEKFNQHFSWVQLDSGVNPNLTDSPKKTDSLENLLEGKQPVSSDTWQLAADAEILKELGRGGRRRDRSQSSSSSREGKKGLIGISFFRRRYRKKPGQLVTQHLQQQREVSGETNPWQEWHLQDSSRHLRKIFGVMKGLGRCHVGLQEIIWGGLDADHLHSMALACQLSKALYQVALDHGDSSVPDILQDPQFKREEVGMRKIRSCTKAMKDLESQDTTRKKESTADPNEDDGGGDAATSARAKKKMAWKLKQKTDE